MFYLDNEYGNDGYVVWFRTLEALGKKDFHYLDLNKKTTLMYLSSKCRVDEKRYLEIIEVLVTFGEFDIQLWEEHKILWNQKFVNSIEDAYKRRVNDCITRDGLVKKLGFLPTETRKEGVKPDTETHKEVAKPDVKGDINPQSKVKYSKVEDRIGKDIGAVPKGPTASNEFYSKEFVKAKGHPLTEKYFRLISYIYNLDPNIINEPGTHILKLKKQLSFEQFVDLTGYVANRPTAVIKDMIDSWLNNPKYSKDRISVYAVLHTWARKEPIQGTNLSSKRGEKKEPILLSSIGKEK